MKSILFICIGNICRSPMAEGLLKHAQPDLAVLSAGINALVGEPADPLSIALLRDHGIDISEHRARSLASWMVNEADVILTMDAGQKRFIENKYPESKSKVFRLCEDRQCDISDPYRHGPDAFRVAFNLISQGVDELMVRLAHIGEKKRYDLTAIREKQQAIF
ncbi:MAG: low molecular weight protein-tyrosine-phosphatase [Burkholderiaceae bacterium]